MSTAPIGPPSGASVPPQLPPPKRNNAVLWILAIVGGGFVVLVLGGLLVASMFIRHVRVNQTGKQVEIETPAGALRVNGDQVHATGLPVYPGAQPDKSEGSTVEFSAIAAQAWDCHRKVRHVRRSRRSLGVVQAAARSQLSNARIAARATHGEHVSSEADVAYVYEKGDTTRLVALTKKSERVEIELLRIGKKEVQ